MPWAVQRLAPFWTKMIHYDQVARVVALILVGLQRAIGIEGYWQVFLGGYYSRNELILKLIVIIVCRFIWWIMIIFANLLGLLTRLLTWVFWQNIAAEDPCKISWKMTSVMKWKMYSSTLELQCLVSADNLLKLWKQSLKTWRKTFKHNQKGWPVLHG